MRLRHQTAIRQVSVRVRPRSRARIGAGLAIWTALWLASTVRPASAQAGPIWPPLFQNQWHWIEPQSNLSAAEIQGVLKGAIAESPAFEAPELPGGIVSVRRFKLATKSRVAGVKVDGTWQATKTNRHGYRSVFVPLDPMTAATLWYITEARQRRWNVMIYSAASYSFYFASEDLARHFINALASARKRQAPPANWLKVGMMTQDLTPAQAADAGRPRVDSVLVGMVAIGGPADRAGIQAYDVVLEFNGAAVLNQYQFDKFLSSTTPGTSVILTLLHRASVPDAAKLQVPEGVRYQYTWERKTVSVTPQ
jgi:hypothetical protein